MTSAEAEQDLLAAIFHEPEADAPRLVYADWLLEKGDPRGDLIRLQLSGDAAAEPKIRTLLKKHQAAWTAPVKQWVYAVRFRRGFVDRVECQLAKFLDGAEELARFAPGLEVAIAGVKSRDFDALAAAPLGKFRSVRLDSQKLGNWGVVALVGSKTIAGLKKLGLGLTRMGPPGAAAIGLSEWLRSLLELDAGKTALLTDGARSILGSRHLAGLRKLELDYAQCGPGVGPAIATTTMTELEYLSVGGNPIGDEGAIEIARAGEHLGKLRLLRLYNCELGPKTYEAFADAKGFASLRQLDLGGHNASIPPELRARIDARFPLGRRS